MKTKTLNIRVNAVVKVDYSDAELEAMGKTFREFKAGMEQLVRQELLPALAADPHTTIDLLTIGFPTSKIINNPKMSKAEKRIAKIMKGVTEEEPKND